MTSISVRRDIQYPSVLDVGCGSHPWGTVNLDLNTDRSEHHRYNYDPRNIPHFTRASAEKLPYRDKSFDVVVSRHCLEHLPYPLEALHDWSRVARRRVVVIVPNKVAMLDHPSHLYAWSLPSLRNLLSLVFPEVKVYASTPLSELYQNRFTKPIMRQRDARKPLGRLLAWLLGYHLYAVCEVEPYTVEWVNK